MTSPLSTAALAGDQRVLAFDAVKEQERILTNEMLPGLIEEPSPTRVWISKMMGYIETLQRDKVRYIEGKFYACYRVGELFFEQDQSALLPTHTAQIDQWQRQLFNFQVAMTFKGPGRALLIEGYASLEGTIDYNRKLAQKRVESVAGYIQGPKAVPEDCILKLAVGEDEPLDSDRLEPNEWDRRVSIYTVGEYKSPPPKVSFPVKEKKESFLFRLQSIGGFGLSAGLGFEVQRYIIYDPNNDRMGDFIYIGGTAGLGFGAFSKALKNPAAQATVDMIDDLFDWADKANNLRKGVSGNSELEPDKWIQFDTPSLWSIELFEGPASHLDVKGAIYYGGGVEHLLLNAGEDQDEVDIPFSPKVEGEFNFGFAYGVGEMKLVGIAEGVDDTTPNLVFRDEYDRPYSPF